ncbi:MAG: hypothetical protein RLZZ436_3000 [Planctomycetota bacterium]
MLWSWVRLMESRVGRAWAVAELATAVRDSSTGWRMEKSCQRGSAMLPGNFQCREQIRGVAGLSLAVRWGALPARRLRAFSLFASHFRLLSTFDAFSSLCRALYPRASTLRLSVGASALRLGVGRSSCCFVNLVWACVSRETAFSKKATRFPESTCFPRIWQVGLGHRELAKSSLQKSGPEHAIAAGAD